MRFRNAVIVITALMLGFGGYLGYLGYWGGNVFTVIPAKGEPAQDLRGLTIVIFSGDMGFNVGMGPQIADRFAVDGTPVVGVNSLTYFRTRRDIYSAAKLIQRAIDRAFEIPGTRRVALIGQSFGADMLHAGLTRLPEVERRKVLQVALVVPGDSINFRASPAELFNLEAPDAEALSTARQLNWVPVTCVHGALETNSLCPSLTMPNVEQVTLPGGHPLKRNVTAVYAVLSSAIATTLSNEPGLIRR